MPVRFCCLTLVLSSHPPNLVEDPSSSGKFAMVRKVTNLADYIVPFPIQASLAFPSKRDARKWGGKSKIELACSVGVWKEVAAPCSCFCAGCGKKTAQKRKWRTGEHSWGVSSLHFWRSITTHNFLTTVPVIQNKLLSLNGSCCIIP